MYVCCHHSGGAPLRLKLREDATVSEALKHILQEQAKDTASKPLKLPVDVAYHFYMAEGNGTPDTTFPLNAKSILRKFGDTFCLVDNPQFQEGMIGPPLLYLYCLLLTMTPCRQVSGSQGK